MLSVGGYLYDRTGHRPFSVERFSGQPGGA